MECRRAFEIELRGFLQHPRDAAWDDFRAHYPRCAACAAEVHAHTEVALLLAPEHPDPERLLRLEDAPASLDAAERTMLRTHVAGCVGCRDELAALRRLAPAIQQATSTPRRAATARRRWLPSVGHWLWQPGVAWAAVLALVVYSTLGPSGQDAFERSVPTAAQAPASRDEPPVVGGAQRLDDTAPPAAAPEPVRPAPPSRAKEGRALDATPARDTASGPSATASPAERDAATDPRLAREEAPHTTGDVAKQRAIPSQNLSDRVAPAPPPPPATLDAAPEQPEAPPADHPLGGALAGVESRARFAARSEPKAAAGAPPALLSPHPTTRESALLQLTVPDAPAEVDVELRAVDGRRRLTERATPSAAGAVALTLAADWLETGPYDVLVRDPSGRLLYTTRVQVRR